MIYQLWIKEPTESGGGWTLYSESIMRTDLENQGRAMMIQFMVTQKQP